MGCFTGTNDSSRNYYQETTDTLAAQINLAPWQYAAESTYEPLYTNLNVKDAYLAMLGTNGQNGLLNLYRNISPALTGISDLSRTQGREADVEDVAKLGGLARMATEISDPANAGLINTLTGQSQNELNLGSNLSAPELRQAQQAVRSRDTGMLGGTGSAGDLSEAMGVSAYGQQLRSQRQGQASQVVTLRNKVYGDPFQQILGRASNATPVTQAVNQGAGMTSGTLFNPESSYASNIYGSNAGYNSLYSDPSTVSKISSVMGLGNSGGGGY